MDIKVIDAPQHFALIARETCSLDRIGNALAKVLPWCYKAAKDHLANPMPICRYTGWRERDCDIEAGFLITEKIPSEIGTRVIEIPAGSTVMAEHKGPYHELVNTHNAIHQFMEENGWDFNGPPWEHYTTDPAKTPHDEMVTLVYCPVKPKDS